MERAGGEQLFRLTTSPCVLTAPIISPLSGSGQRAPSERTGLGWNSGGNRLGGSAGSSHFRSIHYLQQHVLVKIRPWDVEINEDRPSENKQSLFIQNWLYPGSQPPSFVFGRDSKVRSGVGKLYNGKGKLQVHLHGWLLAGLSGRQVN